MAVSGGVDSMALLAILAAHKDYDLVIAHIDHGIRPDSAQDGELVERAARTYNLPFITTQLELGPGASEAAARAGRYNWLFRQMHVYQAGAVITAHHADDVLETSIMNVRRGTDRYGAAGGMRHDNVLRPLIRLTKQELTEYARQHQLVWHEDSTNNDVQYTRNQIRHEVIPSTDLTGYKNHIAELQDLNKKIDSRLRHLVSISGDTVTIQRGQLNSLSLREVEVLLAYGMYQIDPSLELSQPKVAELARRVVLDTTKKSFSLAGTTRIIVTIL